MFVTFLTWAGAVIGLLALVFIVFFLYMYVRHMANRPKATRQELKHKPRPSEWRDTEVTFSWIGHSTILLNLFGVKIITDPVLCEGIGVQIPGIGQ
ncbi:MAG TPA: MBL fold metallo-hydrolase, partial [Brevibacillus sp.]|nr:MBL fold metallo-hydrolase [Brevibacillus sp.]